MKKRITIFVNGNHLTFDYAENVEDNLVAWLESMLNEPDRKMEWRSSDNLIVVLKGAAVDGYYLRKTPPPEPETTPSQNKMLELLNKMVEPDSYESWKKP